MKKVDAEVIKRFLDGKEKKGEKELILDWFADFQAETSLRNENKRYWDGIPGNEEIPAYNEESILNSIHHDIRIEESRKIDQTRGISRLINIFSKIAAVLFIPLVVYLVIVRNEIFTIDNRISFSEIYAPAATRCKFYLPDGSTGWLNSGSTLIFPTEFKGKSRDVSLEGEAYFEIQSNLNKPFIVKGNEVTAIAYGTSINMRAYPEEKLKEVTLVSGRIEVYIDRHGRIVNKMELKPDQMYQYDQTSQKSKIISADAEQVIAWKEGKLVFKDDPLGQVVHQLNLWYNVNIVFKDKTLESFIYRASFQDETIDEVLKLLKISAPIEYRDLGRKINEDGSFEKRRIELYYRP